MLRRLHLLLTVVSTLLLVGVLVLWARSGDWNDEFVLRTARSYVTGPLVKRIALRSTSDGVAVSVHVKVTPSVALESPPWREDVPVGGRVAAAADDTATFAGAVVKLPYPPGSRWGRSMTPREQSDFETRAQADYGSERRLRWTSDPPADFAISKVLAAGAVAPMPSPLLERLGIQPFEAFLVGDDLWPGAHREVGALVPFPLAAGMAAVALVSWLPRWVKRGMVRRRLRRGM